MAKSPEEMAASMIANMPEKTGKSLEEWLLITRAIGLDKHRAILNHLKSEHGITHGFANLIALKTLEDETKPAVSNNDLVDAQYSGPKAELRPIYEKVIEAINSFGDDTEVAPKKAYVSLRRKKQFAIIQPSTKTRVDVGLNMKGVDTTERLEASGSFNSMVSHRVRLSAVENIDAELIGWLKQAYEGA